MNVSNLQTALKEKKNFFHNELNKMHNERNSQHQSTFNTSQTKCIYVFIWILTLL